MFNFNRLAEIREKIPEKPLMQKLKCYACQMGCLAESVFINIQKAIELRQSTNDKNYKFEFLKFQFVKTQSNVCAKILPRAIKAFKCHDCIFENNSIMCMQCFENSDHKGHIYEVVEVYGGCCDCGDEEKWNPQGFCKSHSNKNLVNEMQEKVDKNEQQRFLKQLSYCFVYYFVLYDQAVKFEQSKLLTQNQKQQLIKFYIQASQFGKALIQYLCQFNKDSLISNIMTFNLLKYKIPLKKLELSFCPQAEDKTILEIIFHILKLKDCSQKAVNLFTRLFTLRQFRRQLTITFMRLHHQSPEFAMSGYNHLTCQLLTSHKMISELVQSKEIQPLVYKPKYNGVQSFVELAKNLLHYYIDIDYLSRLYKDTPQKYMCYHIMQGEIMSLGYYRQFSHKYQEGISYYGIQQVGLSKVITIMSIIKQSPQCLFVLQKGMQDLWRQSFRLYKQQKANSLHYALLLQSPHKQNVYITYQLQLALLMFTYLEKLQQQYPTIGQQEALMILIKVFDLNDNKNAAKKILQMIQIVNKNLILTGLTLGHPQTMELFYTYYSYTFKKSLSMISLTFYLYKMLTKLLILVNSKCLKSENQQSLSKQQLSDYKINSNICQQPIFQQPLNHVKFLLNEEDFNDDGESIFDRKKHLLRLTYFLHLLIEASQTDFYELIIASLIGFANKEKYQTKLNKFYIQLLKNYNKISVKEFKQIVDSIIVNNQAFEKFISSSKQISIQHGKISLKNFKQLQLTKQVQSRSKQESVKIESELNLFYFKSLKNKLINLNEKQVIFKTPKSSNHFLYEILSQEFVCQLLRLLSGYIDMLVIVNGNIMAQESGTLGLLVIEMIKIGKAFTHKKDSKIPQMIFDYFRNLQQKKANLSIFSDELIKIICSESQQSSTKLQDSMKSLNQEAQLKAEQRKRKLQEKKKRMKAKFKQNQQKFEQAYVNELKKIRDEMQEENQQMQQQQSQQSKVCIICREGQEKQKFKLMCFMQLSDCYQLMITGKQPSSLNSHLVFKTCGHFIHEKCHKKTIKNQYQQYSVCQLCKSTVNCLFPICVKNQQQNEKQKGKEKSQFKDKALIQLQKEELYQNLKETFSLLSTIDYGLRENCENGFSQSLMDEKQMKTKLLQSLATEIVFSAVICQQLNHKTFNSKQINIYRNILHALIIFDNGQENQLHNKNGKKQPSLSQQMIDMIAYKLKQIKIRTKKQQNQQRKKILQIAYQMEIYVLAHLYKYFSPQKQSLYINNDLSSECLKVIDNVLIRFANDENISKNKEIEGKKQQNDIKFSDCSQNNLMSKQIKFFTPPQSLQQLIKMRGKCPNCQKFTNFISTCLICEWKGCKGCEKESLFDHTRNQHCGNSIYLDANVGNIYFVSKKKYWDFGSFYQDYLGEKLHIYEQGVKLQRYTLNEHMYDKIKRTPLMYNVESTIRYEEYSKKKQFIGNI